CSYHILLSSATSTSHLSRKVSSTHIPQSYLSHLIPHTHAKQLHRRDHAPDVHPRVRSAPAAVRLDSRRARTARAASASVRICPAQSYLLGHQQAQTHPASERKTRERLGRPAHGHDSRL